jgi:hypothetical protein
VDWIRHRVGRIGGAHCEHKSEPWDFKDNFLDQLSEY